MRRLLLSALALLSLVACGGPSATATPTFARHTIPAVIEAFTAHGLSAEDVRDGAARKQTDLWPNVALERQVFTIAAIAPGGGVIQTFADRKDMDAMSAYYARFPDIVPYVYAHGNILVQLDNGLPKVEAEKYRIALESMR